jgi:putative transposase
MRSARIKAEGEAVYHCMTRVVNGERVLDETAREVLRKQVWQIADYCGVQVLTYAVMANHFHVLVRVPDRPERVADEELLRRYQVLYPKPTRFQSLRLEVLKAQIGAGDPEAEAWRVRQLKLMHDISPFMKLLKQRFTRWFNRTHNRYGTLWAERFKSVLVEPADRVIQAMAAYIDLNAVRANLVNDPKDYRFCGYAEAVAGGAKARAGLMSVSAGNSWAAAQSAYRQVLFGTGAGAREKGAVITTDDFQRVIAEGGQLPLSAVLRCRLRYFSDGAVLGSKAFISHLRSKRDPQQVPKPPSTVAPLQDLATWHPLRGRAWG